MSLLMDALKKAEQEKKEAAKRLQESEQEGQLHADDTGKNIIQTEADTEKASVEATGEHDSPDKFLSTVQLSLEPIESRQDPEQKPAPAQDKVGPANEEVTLNVTLEDIPIAPQQQSEAEQSPSTIDSTQRIENLHESDSIEPLDETFHGVSFDDNPELFQETMQGEAYEPQEAGSTSYEETLPGVPALQLAQDIGAEDQPTPVAAQTVFTATGTTKGTSNLKWPLFVGLGFIAIVSFGVFYYFSEKERFAYTPAPLLAKGMGNIVPTLPPSGDIAAGSVSGTLISGQQIAAVGGTNSVTNELSSAAPEQLQHADPSLQKQTETITENISEQGVAMSESEDVSAEEVPLPEPQVIAKSDPESSEAIDMLPPTINVAPALIKITRSKVPDNKGLSISEAYAAFQAQDLNLAETKYREVLNFYPGNRDALLGLGAIALNKGDPSTAAEIYAKLLIINPRDEVARALLINLDSNEDISNSESTIKLLLHEHPDSSHLYFTLGNIYAKQSRWAEAQQAFFDAYRNDPSNPDYAHNLAVSLDYIGQVQTALDYYNVALELVADKPIRFDTAEVMSRINTLSGVIEP